MTRTFPSSSSQHTRKMTIRSGSVKRSRILMPGFEEGRERDKQHRRASPLLQLQLQLDEFLAVRRQAVKGSTAASDLQAVRRVNRFFGTRALAA